MSSPTSYDVILIGGALFGGSTAYHLLSRDPSLRVCVVERDPTYEKAPSALSMAGIRLLFSQPENLLMSRYGHEFFSDFGALTKVGETEIPLHFWKQGYLFVANTAEQARDMEANYRFQTDMGVDAELLSPEQIPDRFPSMSSDEAALATLSPHDGWIDPYGALTGFRRKVIALGGTYLHGEVVGIERNGNRIGDIILADGQRLRADWVINTAGVQAAEVGAMAGMKLPVVPLPRTQFYFETPADIEPMPLTRDQSRAGFRPEGAGFMTGMTDFSRAGQFVSEPDHDSFLDHIWPALASRVPAFETLKVKAAYATHYALNTLDGNLIIGPWAGGAENFLVAAGCSGHGLQHAPAIGRGLSEIILDGGFQTIDLTRLGYQRVIDNAPYKEAGVKA